MRITPGPEQKITFSALMGSCAYLFSAAKEMGKQLLIVGGQRMTSRKKQAIRIVYVSDFC